MTWYESEEFHGAMLHERALDVSARYLDELREIYKDGQGRSPSVAELQAALVAVMSKFGGRWFTELDRREVTKLKLKSKRQPEFQAFSRGDQFAIPLNAGDFAFGRLIYLSGTEEPTGAIEVFSELRPRPVIDDDVLASERLLAPIWIDTHKTLAMRAFTVLRSHPEERGPYVAPDHDEIEFLVGSPARWFAEKLDGSRRVIGLDETPEWDERTRLARDAHSVVFMIERRLGRRHHEWEPDTSEPHLES